MQELFRRFHSLNIKGILHIGAHECEELKDYQTVGVNVLNTYTSCIAY